MLVRRYLAAKALTTCLMASPAYAAAHAVPAQLQRGAPAPASATLASPTPPPRRLTRRPCGRRENARRLRSEEGPP